MFTMKSFSVQPTRGTRRLATPCAAKGEKTPIQKGAMVLLGMGAAVAVASGGPADAASFTEKVQEQQKAFEAQSSKLEYLLEQQMNAAKATAKGKEEVRSHASRAPAHAPDHAATQSQRHRV